METNRGVTGRGWAWELLNSWWIAFSLADLCWIGFFYIGRKARQRKWIVMGFIFLALQTVSFILGGLIPESVFRNVMIFLWLCLYPAGIILSFMERKNYLICRDVLISANAEEKERQDYRAAVMRHYAAQGVISAQPAASFAVREPVETPTENELLDVNRCCEADLATLPGVSVALAMKAVRYRTEHNGFASTQEFYSVLELKPHFIVQLEDRISCGAYPGPLTSGPAEPADPGASPERKGRKLDL